MNDIQSEVIEAIGIGATVIDIEIEGTGIETEIEIVTGADQKVGERDGEREKRIEAETRTEKNEAIENEIEKGGAIETRKGKGGTTVKRERKGERGIMRDLDQKELSPKRSPGGNQANLNSERKKRRKLVQRKARREKGFPSFLPLLFLWGSLVFFPSFFLPAACKEHSM